MQFDDVLSPSIEGYNDCHVLMCFSDVLVRGLHAFD